MNNDQRFQKLKELLMDRSTPPDAVSAPPSYIIENINVFYIVADKKTGWTINKPHVTANAKPV